MILPGPGNAHAVMLMAELAHLARGSLDNMDPAIDMLKKIAPNVMPFWSSYDQHFNLLNSGQAWISVTSTDRTIDQMLKGAPVAATFPEQGTVFISNAFGVSKGTKNKELAGTFIDFVLSKDVQKGIADILGFMPVREDVDIKPVVNNLMPQDASLKNSLLPDWSHIADKQVGWIERYTK